jgi:hypothetical protein
MARDAAKDKYPAEELVPETDEQTDPHDGPAEKHQAVMEVHPVA